MSGRLLSVGDIHGCFLPLLQLMEAVNPDMSDIIVFLGDYIDRGSKSKEVIRLLSDLELKTNCVFILGNHEEMALASEEDPEVLAAWLRYGGKNTLKSFDAINEEYYIQWDRLGELKSIIEKCVPIFVHEKFIFSHSPIRHDVDFHVQDSLDLRWSSQYPNFPHISGNTLVYGHLTLPNNKILVDQKSNSIGLETNIKNGGVLSCLDLYTGTVWQSNIYGEVKMFNINPVWLGYNY